MNDDKKSIRNEHIQVYRLPAYFIHTYDLQYCTVEINTENVHEKEGNKILNVFSAIFKEVWGDDPA